MKDKERKAFSNWKCGAVHLNFPNGNWLSTTWAPGSYSENHDKYNFIPRKEFQEMKSMTCEVMIDCGKRLHNKLHKKYGGDGSVIAYLTINQWADIVNQLATQRRKKQSPNDKGDTAPEDRMK